MSGGVPPKYWRSAAVKLLMGSDTVRDAKIRWTSSIIVTMSDAACWRLAGESLTFFARPFFSRCRHCQSFHFNGGDLFQRTARYALQRVLSSFILHCQGFMAIDASFKLPFFIVPLVCMNCNSVGMRPRTDRQTDTHTHTRRA